MPQWEIQYQQLEIIVIGGKIGTRPILILAYQTRHTLSHYHGWCIFKPGMQIFKPINNFVPLRSRLSLLFNLGSAHATLLHHALIDYRESLTPDMSEGSIS